MQVLSIDILFQDFYHLFYTTFKINVLAGLACFNKDIADLFL